MQTFKFRVPTLQVVALLFTLLAILPSTTFAAQKLSESEISDLKSVKKSVLKILQEYLNANGSTISVDGVYGAETANAILEYRKKNETSYPINLNLPSSILKILEGKAKPATSKKPDSQTPENPNLSTQVEILVKKHMEGDVKNLNGKITSLELSTTDISNEITALKEQTNDGSLANEVNAIKENIPSFWEAVVIIAGSILFAALAAIGFSVWFFKNNQTVSENKWKNEKEKISNSLERESEKHLSSMTTISSDAKNSLLEIPDKVNDAKKDLTNWTASEFSKNKEKLNDSLERKIEGCVESLAKEHSNHLTALVILKVSMAQWRQFDQLPNDQQTLHLRRNSINESISLAKHAHEYAMKLNKNEKNESIKNQCISMYAYTLADGCKRLSKESIYVEEDPMKKARELIEKFSLENLKTEKQKHWYRILDTYVFVHFVSEEHQRAENLFKEWIWDNNDIQQDWKMKRLSIYRSFQPNFLPRIKI